MSYIDHYAIVDESLDRLLAEDRVVRRLVSGGVGLRRHQELLDVLGQGEKNHAWKAGVLEVFRTDAAPFPLADVVNLIPGSILWQSDWLAGRESLELTLVLRDRTKDRLNRLASQSVLGLFDQLSAQDFHAVGGLGSSVSNIGGLPTSCQEARVASRYGVLHGPGIYTYQALRELGGLGTRDLDPFPDRFASALLAGEPLSPLVDEFFAVLAASQGSVRRLHQDIQRLFSRLADLIPPTPGIEPYYHVLDGVRVPDDLRRALVGLCDLAAKALEERRSSLADRKVKEFREFVGSQYQNCGLSLTEVSRALQISPSYLGKLLKRRLGTSFVDFVTEVRMAKARELLSGSDLMTYEIAESVGYPYTHYFSATFKRHVGATPSEYRAQTRARCERLGSVAGVS